MDNKEPEHGVYQAYRRTSYYDEPVPEWEDLVNEGYADRYTNGREYIYKVTDKGMQEVADETGLLIRYTIEIEPRKQD